MALIDRVAHRLKMRDLRLFDAVVRMRSLAKAAKDLNVSQPAVSKSILELEHAFGVQLLYRNRQGVEPTDHGRALLECGAVVLDELRQGVKKIEFLIDPTVGEVRIGTTAFLAVSFVSSVVDRLSRRYPRMVFHLSTGTVGSQYRELRARNLDLLVTRKLGVVADVELDFKFLFDDSFVVAAGAQNRWARRRRVQLADLVDEPWVLPPPEAGVASFAIEAFRARGFCAPRATVFATTPETRLSLVAGGRFCHFSRHLS